MHSPSLAPSPPPPPLLKFIALGVYGLFPSWCTSPPLSVSSGICLLYVLCSGCFCSCLWIYVPFHTSVEELPSLSSPSSPSSPASPCLLALFSPRFPPTPILADRQTNSFFWSRVVSWCCLFSQLTAWTHTRRDTHTQTCSHQSNTINSEGSTRWHKYEPNGAVLRGTTQVSLRWT